MNIAASVQKFNIVCPKLLKADPFPLQIRRQIGDFINSPPICHRLSPPLFSLKPLEPKITITATGNLNAQLMQSNTVTFSNWYYRSFTKNQIIDQKYFSMLGFSFVQIRNIQIQDMTFDSKGLRKKSGREKDDRRRM